MTLDPADVLRAAAEWVWVPPEAHEVRTDEFRVIAYPAHFNREAGCRLALVRGRVETSAPVLQRAGFQEYGQERSYLLARA